MNAAESPAEASAKTTEKAPSENSPEKPPAKENRMKNMLPMVKFFIPTILQFIGGSLIVAGTLLPWQDSESTIIAAFAENGYDTSSSNLTGVGLWGDGNGLIVFLLGLLILGGVFGATFRISPPVYLGTLGLSALFLNLVYIDFNLPVSNLGYGIWISLIGSGIVVLALLYTFFNKSFFGGARLLAKGAQVKMLGLMAIAIPGSFVFPTGSEQHPLLANSDPIYLLDDNTILGIGKIALLFILLALALQIFTGKNPSQIPSSLVLLFSAPILFVELTGIAGNFWSKDVFAVDSGSTTGIAVSNLGAQFWILFFISVIIVVISFRSERSYSPDLPTTSS